MAALGKGCEVMMVNAEKILRIRSTAITRLHVIGRADVDLGEAIED